MNIIIIRYLPLKKETGPANNTGNHPSLACPAWSSRFNIYLQECCLLRIWFEIYIKISFCEVGHKRNSAGKYLVQDQEQSKRDWQNKFNAQSVWTRSSMQKTSC